MEGPSGVGKDTVVRELMKKYPHKYVKMPSTATRAMRPGESQGNPYFFVTREEFQAKIASGDVFEYTVLPRDGEYRGMSHHIIDNILASDKIQIKDCDEIGLRALKKEYGDLVMGIFLVAEKEEIEKRLRARGGTEEEIAKRLGDFEEYMKYAHQFDHIITNDNLMDCVDKVDTIISR